MRFTSKYSSGQRGTSFYHDGDARLVIDLVCRGGCGRLVMMVVWGTAAQASELYAQAMQADALEARSAATTSCIWQAPPDPTLSYRTIPDAPPGLTPNLGYSLLSSFPLHFFASGLRKTKKLKRTMTVKTKTKTRIMRCKRDTCLISLDVR